MEIVGGMELLEQFIYFSTGHRIMTDRWNIKLWISFKMPPKKSNIG